jgi:hypothetical protein
MEDIKKYEEEKETILKQLQNIDIQRNQLMVRLAEIQGVFKYLKEQELNNKE